ncbi:DUF2007 domain-containing protein [bacterium]|nr:DUF2007 domain-containing protein [bacterium]
MNQEFVVLAEYGDDLDAQMVQSALFDADIDAELEQERPRGMKSGRETTVIRIMVRPHDLQRARKMIRSGAGSAGIYSEPDLTDYDTADFDSSDSMYEF